MKSTRPTTLLAFSLIALLFVLQLACGMESSAPMAPPAAVATRIAVPTEAQTVELPPAVPETRMLTLEYPPSIRAGDSDVVRLTLEVDNQGNLTPTVSVAGNVTEGQVVVIPNVYETHNVLAEARLDLAGADVRPSDIVSETLLPGQKVTFYWSVKPGDIGNYKGTVWFYLHFVPKAGGVESRQALSAQTIEISSTALFGIKAGVARWLGLAGTFIGSVLGFPFLEQVLKLIWNRIRGKA
jgi:hypothetical protein